MEFYNKKRLGDILISAGVINEEQLVQALKVQREKGKKLGETLIDLGLTNELTIADALCSQLNCDLVVLSERRIDPDITKLVNEEILRKHTAIPFEYKKGYANILRVAMANPLDLIAIDDFAIITNLQIEPAVATPQDIAAAIDKYYGNIEALKVAERYTQERDNLLKSEQTQENNTDEVDNAPIVVLVRTIIEQGIRQRASDIHIEPMENELRVRYRIDGVLNKGRRFNSSLIPAVIARIKIIGGMDIAEKRKPQDGRITMNVGRIEYDIRASILPTVYGEKVVLRIATKSGFTIDKRKLGLSEEELIKFDNIISKPHGIILITGPTGSGKSTTLYTVLTSLNRDGVNIITVEDPVEAHIDGINQVQVNEKASLTFSSALRSILRQDPDIIMIGEIRDSETAEIAVKASITGHLVTSTLHTNSAAGAVTRLIDMEIEPYLLSEAITGVIAQRLIRRLCPDCKRKKVATNGEKRKLGIDITQPLEIYEACGCVKCNDTGYIGRIGIYEILTTSPRIREAIRNELPIDKIEEIAITEGMVPLRQRAVEFILEGISSVEELLRVAVED